MEELNQEEIRKIVREKYSKIAEQSSSCCNGTVSRFIPCCGTASSTVADVSKSLGYSDEELSTVPEGANLGLGCGNPVALASLKKGETVLDLGSGAGFDSFLAAAKVGAKGKVIGIDMTAEMLERARENVRKGGYTNIEFRLGEIENLPVADNSIDAIISNCVINLASNKQRVFDEAFRVLKPGGRLMVTDIVTTKELPSFIKNSIDAYAGCIAGAMNKSAYLKAIRKSGFKAVRVIEESAFPVDLDSVMIDILSNNSDGGIELIEKQISDIPRSIASIKVRGLKPKLAK